MIEKELHERTVDAFDLYELVRKKDRPRSRDLIPKVFDKFIQFREGFPEDKNIVGGFAELDGKPLFVIGQNWRTISNRKILSTITAKGYSLALEIMRLAEKQKKPLVTFIDTPGGDPLMESAELLQCWKISDCIYTLAGLKVPVISVIIGEGGSGGALALQVADRTYMLENAVFSVISPEGCAQILFKGLNKKPREEKLRRYREMAHLLRPTSQDLLQIGVIDGIIDEPMDGAHSDHVKTAKNIRNVIQAAFLDLEKVLLNELLVQRYQRYLRYGQWHEEPTERESSLIKKLTGRIFGGIKKIFRGRNQQSGALEVSPVEKEIEFDSGKFHVCKNKECGAKTPLKKYVKNYKVCPQCGSIDRESHPTAYEWIRYLADKGSFVEMDGSLVPLDPLNFSFQTDAGKIKRYVDDMEKDREKTGVKEALIIGTARIKGKEVVVAVSEYGYRGGSLSSVVGEKFVRAVNHANQKGCPLISVTMSGGARMQEGIHSLLQMAKTNMALTRRQVPYISILADPTLAGSLSSYVSRGDIHLAEENAEIGFAGTRVVEGYLKTRLRDAEGNSPGWYFPEFYLERGGINEIVPRKKMKERVHAYLELLRKFADME